MIHYTLNTGHSRVSPREEVDEEVLDAMRPLCSSGTHWLSSLHTDFYDYFLVVPEGLENGYLGALYCGTSPILTLGVAADAAGAAEVWPEIESLYLKITELPGMRGADFAAPRMPSRLPWIAVVLISPLRAPAWAGDFERCLAWAWLTYAPSSWGPSPAPHR